MRFFSVLASTLIIGLAAATMPASAAATPTIAFTSRIQPNHPTPSVAAAAPSGLTKEQIDSAISVLQTPKERDALIATLRALRARANVKAYETTNAPPPASSFTMDTVHKVAKLTLGLGRDLRSATNITPLVRWIGRVVTNSWLRQTLLDTSWRLAIVIATALGAERLVAWLLAKPQAALIRANQKEPPADAGGSAAVATAEGGETEKLPRKGLGAALLRRAAYAVAYYLLALVPITLVALIGIAWLASSLITGRPAQLVITAVLEAYIVCRFVLESARLLIAPDRGPLRLVPLSDYRAGWLVDWLRRVIAVIAFGVAAVQTSALFGLNPEASQVLLKLVSLCVHLMLAIMILQVRRPVAAFIRGDGSSDVIGSLRATVAQTWHLLALFYVIALWAVWAIGVPNAFTTMLRVVIVVVVITLAARGAIYATNQFIDAVFADSAQWHAAYPALHTRRHTYRTALRTIAAVIVSASALLVILQFWGLSVITWLASTPEGQRTAGGAITILSAALAALVAWEFANVSLNEHVERLLRQGRPERAARFRTLLPMLRTTLLITLGIILALVILSAFGVNIALLLGGLSIVGLAVGFGSQKLVQDIITGLFLLLEDAMQVGDWVSLGGVSGSVERLSIRTIRLRGSDGSLNIIPFSAVTTVSNSSREFCFAPVNVGVAYKEDLDHVFMVMRDEFDKMRKDPNFERSIIADLELWGLDRFGASSLDIVGRIRCLAGQQWSVKREYNRRIKIRFDEEGIEIPFTYQRITINPDEFRAAFSRSPTSETAQAHASKKIMDLPNG